MTYEHQNRVPEPWPEEVRGGLRFPSDTIVAKDISIKSLGNVAKDPTHSVKADRFKVEKDFIRELTKHKKKDDDGTGKGKGSKSQKPAGSHGSGSGGQSGCTQNKTPIVLQMSAT